jgi:hypothetical protein
LKRDKLFLFILFVVIASKGFCDINDSNNNTPPKTTEPSNKQDFSKKPVEKDKIDLGITEANQIKAYNSLDNKIVGLEKQIRQTKEEIDKKFDYMITFRMYFVPKANGRSVVQETKWSIILQSSSIRYCSWPMWKKRRFMTYARPLSPIGSGRD